MSFFTLIIKDLKIVLSDKKAFILLVAMPIILFVILSFALASAFNDSDSEIWTINVGVVKLYDFEQDFEKINAYANRSDAEAIENILFDVLDDEALSFIKYDFYSYDQALKLLEDDDLAGVIVLPESYVSDMMLNMTPDFRKPIHIKVIKSIERTYSAEIIENIVSGLTDQLSQLMIANKVTQEVLAAYDIPVAVIDQVLETMQETSDQLPALKVIINDYKIDQLKSVNSGQYYSVAMMTMFLLFGASYGARFMLIEKMKFTLQRQIVAGVSSFRLVSGKMALIFCIAILQIALMMLTSIIGFKVYWGEPIFVMLYTLLVAFAITGFGAFLSALALKMDNVKALNILESGLFQVIALFGGSYLPLYQMPEWFQSVSKIILNGAALDGYHNLMIGAPIKEMLPGLISLMLNGVVFTVLGIILMRRASFKSVEKEIEVTS